MSEPSGASGQMGHGGEEGTRSHGGADGSTGQGGVRRDEGTQVVLVDCWATAERWEL